MTIRLRVTVCALLWAAAICAHGGPVYQLVGGVCTDSSRPDIGEPPLCNYNIAVRITMVDGYVPGTAFSGTPFETPSPVEEIAFSDGFAQFTSGFPAGALGRANYGDLPEATGRSGVHIHWFDAVAFDTEANGTWSFGEEGLCCGQGYSSWGTYEYWALLLEPPSLALIVMTFGGLIGLGLRGAKGADASPQ